jgi:hypothetical protein
MVFGLEDAARAGLSAAAVRHGVRTGRFVRLRRGLFCDARLWRRSGTSPTARHALETMPHGSLSADVVGPVTTRPPSCTGSRFHTGSRLP